MHTAALEQQVCAITQLDDELRQLRAQRQALSRQISEKATQRHALETAILAQMEKEQLYSVYIGGRTFRREQHTKQTGRTASQRMETTLELLRQEGISEEMGIDVQALAQALQAVHRRRAVPHAVLKEEKN